MSTHSGTIRWVVAAVCAVAAAIALAAVLRPGGGDSSRLTGCTLFDRVPARCGRVAVPADPSSPHGASVDLQVAVLPSTAKPAAGALFYLEGGPGGAATEAALEVNDLFARVQRTRDVVLVDQRGTGGSAPLACPAGRVAAADAPAVTRYLARCFARLGSHATSLLTTSVAADDLDAVRRALGYGPIDIYGGSYGATLGEELMHRHPDAVRSAVLDGASLPTVRVFQAGSRNAARSLDHILARCTADRACRSAYPHPGAELARLLARKPRRVTIESGVVDLTPDDIATTVAVLSQTPAGAAAIPYAVDEAAHGDYVPIARAFDENVGKLLDPRARLAMTWVILCSEPWASADAGATARVGAGYFAHAAVARARLLDRACRVVPRGRVPADSAKIALSHIPVLLLAGSDDPLDPPTNLRGWPRAFPDGRLVVVPGGGHGVLADGCTAALVARFVARGSAAGLDASCARRPVSRPFQIG
jgi:pimeloyl-ACP methyl ester carboxylesterase